MKVFDTQLVKSKFSELLNKAISLLSLSEIIIELEALEVLKQASKARSMIYQCQIKENVAWVKGLPKETYYYMEYNDWVELRNSTF